MHAVAMGAGVLGALALLSAIPAPTVAGWWTIPSVCLATPMMGQDLTLVDAGTQAVSQFGPSSGGCPFKAEEGLRREVQTQAMEWALGLRSELQLDAGTSASDARTRLHRSIILKASRKRILLGFSLEW